MGGLAFDFHCSDSLQERFTTEFQSRNQICLRLEIKSSLYNYPSLY